MPDPIAGVTAPGGAQWTVGAAAPATEKAADKDLFMNLMVAQLKYQNPLEPTSGTEFMAQTAQFTMVETLQTLVDTQNDAARWSRMALAQDLVGQQVELTDPGTGAGRTVTVESVRATADGPVLNVNDGKSATEVRLDDITRYLGAASE